MNGRDERRRRAMITQAVAALVCFLVVHGAHAAVSPTAKVSRPGHAYAVTGVDATARR
ncbi:MAG TPA: hypothetical protein VGJ25_14785 [Gaiellaceae bacterium]